MSQAPRHLRDQLSAVSVRTVPQTFSEAQQQTARDNIGAGSGSSSFTNTLVVTEDGHGSTYDSFGDANADAVSGDAIIAYPATYNERNISKTGVGIAFSVEANVTYTGAIPGGLIDDSVAYGTGAAIVTEIEANNLINEGTGEFIDDGQFPDGYDSVTSIVAVKNADSNIGLRARLLGSLHNFPVEQYGFLINQSNGTIRVQADRMLSGNNSGCIYWWGLGGRLTVNVKDQIRSKWADPEAQCIVTGCAGGAVTGEFFLTAPEIISDSGLAIDHQDDSTSSLVICWFDGISNISGGAVAIRQNQTSPAPATTAKYYYTGCGKVFTTGASSTAIRLGGGNYWMDFQKLEVPAGGAYGIDLLNTAILEEVKIGEAKTLGSCTNIVRANGTGVAVRYLSIANFIGHASAGGILVTATSGNNSFTLADSNINTSANASTVPLSGANGQTIYLKNVHLQSGAASSISNASGTGTLTIVSLGGVTMNVGPGSNVTITGPYTVGADLKQAGALTATTLTVGSGGVNGLGISANGSTLSVYPSTTLTSTAFNLTLTTTATTNATLPSGTITLIDTNSSQAISGKTYTGSSVIVAALAASGNTMEWKNNSAATVASMRYDGFFTTTFGIGFSNFYTSGGAATGINGATISGVANGFSVSNNLGVSGTTESTTTTTGSIVAAGGIGIVKNTTIGGTLSITGATTGTGLITANGGVTVGSGQVLKLGNAATTGLAAGVLAATTNATLVLTDSGGQAYRIPCII